MARSATVARFMPRSITGPVKRRGPSPLLKKAQARLAATRASLRKARQNSGGKSSALITVAANVAGGAVAGVITAMLPNVGPVDTRLLAGAGLVAAGAFVVKGKWGGWMMIAGGAVLACYASDVAEGIFTKDAA